MAGTSDVAFEVDDVDVGKGAGWSVFAQGTVHEVVDADELEPNRDLRLRTWAPGDRCTCCGWTSTTSRGGASAERSTAG